MSHGIAGTLRIRMLAKVELEIILEDSLQSGSDVFARERSFDSVDASHPRAEDSVRNAALSELIFRTFALQQFLHFAAVIIDARHQDGERCVSQAQVLHLLLVVLHA